LVLPEEWRAWVRAIGDLSAPPATDGPGDA